MSSEFKSHRDVWAQFATAALSGYIASGKWDEKAHQKAAAAADEMLKEYDRRVKQAGG
ncbi:hypothetical protein [Pseudomonas sp. R45(2017)]|uniref:hypothetical protein n=1 Tax=Pseudomonas sp. R45(2017) TaxID=1981678 RepID=UPI001592F7E8|nr:hypothetical protein [Pseudomonas sp. R45(2017)]